MWCSAASPTSFPWAARCWLNSAVAVKNVDRADLARRIQEAKEDAADAKDDQTRSKAEQFLSQLTTLEGAILPA